jgi:hypothetical protein
MKGQAVAIAPTAAMAPVATMRKSAPRRIAVGADGMVLEKPLHSYSPPRS